MATVTCHTAGCGNQDMALELDLTFTDDDGQPAMIEWVVCGVCGQQITDVTGRAAP